MLWQRFGRGARDKDIQAAALLFVEPKNLDPVDPPEGRKRKTTEQADGAGPKSKRARKERPAPQVLDTDAAGEEDFWKARKAVYHEPIGDEKKLEPNQVLDDVINAEGRGIGCRRKPFKVYFNDDEYSGSCALLSCTTLNNILQEFVTVARPSMGLVPAVLHENPASVVISATRKSSKICFELRAHHQKLSCADQR
jgi:hypothetical protein